MTKISVYTALLLFTSISPAMDFINYYNQPIIGSPKIVASKIEGTPGQEFAYVWLTLEIQYGVYDTCQKAIALMPPIRILNGVYTNDFQLLMGSAKEFCEEDATIEKKALTLPYSIAINSTFSISNRKFKIYQNSDQTLGILEQR